MHVLPFAISIHKFVNSVGAEVGFASLIAVALLIVMYFAHGRETATLRERLIHAQERIEALEARVAQLAQLQSIRAQQQPTAPPQTRQPTVTPAPVSIGARAAMGSTVASVRRVTPAGGPSAAGTPVPAAPAGMGGPALQSATKLIPDPAGLAPAVAPAAARASEDTMLVAGAASTAAAAAAAARPDTAGSIQAPPPSASPTTGDNGTPNAAPLAATAAAAAGPPRVQIRPDAPATAAPRRPAQPPRRTIDRDGPRDYRTHDGGGRRTLRRLGAIVGALVLVVVIVYALTQLTSSGGSPSTASSQVNHGGANGAFNPADVTVAVLNGTSVGGLAKDVSDTLAAKGYKQGAITNAAVQTQTHSIVSYLNTGTKSHRAANKTAARHVAGDLGLTLSAVHPAGSVAVQSCAGGSGAGAGCHSQVIVTLGTDLAGMASGSGTTN